MKKMNNKTNTKGHILKYVSLVTLTLQNAILGLSMRYATTRTGDRFFNTTAVFMAEVVKLVVCLGLVYIDVGSIRKLLQSLRDTIIRQPLDTLKVCVPSVVYVIQNNLLYVSSSHLDAATYQVTYQMKILTTALFSVAILKRRLFVTQWLSLLVLIGGVVLVQLAQTSDPAKAKPGAPEQNRLIGFLAALGACVLSGFAGVYFEKILKGSDISVWMRNVQLSLCSIPIGIITCFAYDGSRISEHGFFFGYDGFIVYLVLLNACGGLLVAMVVKYADNILKGFATSLAIILTCVASIYLFAFQLSVMFSAGGLLVIAAIFLYGYTPKKKAIPPAEDPLKEENVEIENCTVVPLKQETVSDTIDEKKDEVP